MGECNMKNEMKKWTYIPILGKYLMGMCYLGLEYI